MKNTDSWGKQIRQGWLRIVVSLLIGFVALWFAFRDVDLARMWQITKSVNILYVILFFIGVCFVNLIRIWRWGLLLKPFKNISFWTVIQVGGLGMFLTLALPLRLGEFARPLALKKKTGLSFSLGLSTVVVERIMDGIMVLVVFLVALLISKGGDVPPVARNAAISALMFFGAGLVLLFLLRLWPKPIVTLVKMLLKWLPETIAQKIESMLDEFLKGISGQSVGGYLYYLSMTLLYWVVNSLTYFILFKGFSFSAHLDFLAAFILVGAIVLAILIPGPPGFIGPFQVGLVVGFSFFGIEAAQANAYGIIVHPLIILGQAIFAVPYLFGGKKEVIN